MDLLEVMLNRRSVRKYKKEHIPGDVLERILQAGLAAPSGRNAQPWTFILVQRREMLDQIAEIRVGASAMLKEADAAIVVLGDEMETDVWIEDCSISMAYMHLMADSIGVGSCWVQMRNRECVAGGTAEEKLRELLKFPNTFHVEAILSLGIPETKPIKHHTDQLLMDRVHLGRY